MSARNLQCQECSASNPDGAAFCMSCGAKLTVACLACGAPLLEQAKFCIQCGAKVDSGAKPQDGKEVAGPSIAQRSDPAGERKYVTVFFADVVGSTASMAGLDPEDAHDLIEPAVSEIRCAVENHGGTVCKTMGDGLMALFGAPIAQEDHAIRACKAALDLLRSAKEIHNFRLGLHCGEVVIVRPGSDAEPRYDAIGDVVNFAARLEQKAEPNCAIVSQDIVRAAHKRLSVEALTPLTLKGFDNEVTAYRLTGLCERDPRPDRLTRYPFVGRKRELRILGSLFDEASDGVGQLIMITGDAGIGKSRLAFEAINTAEQDGWIAQHEVWKFFFCELRHSDFSR